MITAWLEPRARCPGPIPNPDGWAENARARINIPFGASLTAFAKRPGNAERSRAGPFAA